MKKTDCTFDVSTIFFFVKGHEKHLSPARLMTMRTSSVVGSQCVYFSGVHPNSFFLGCPSNSFLGCPPKLFLGCPSNSFLGCPPKLFLGCPSNSFLGCPPKLFSGCSLNPHINNTHNLKPRPTPKPAPQIYLKRKYLI